MVTDPVEYKWSSCGAKILAKKDLVVDLHPSYFALGDNIQERQKAYAKYVLRTVPEYEIKLIRDALQRGQLIGSESFRTEIEKNAASAFRIKSKAALRRKINLSPFSL